VKSFQLISTRPLDTQYDIDAKLPAGTTKALFRVMLRSLLIERIGLVIHQETRTMPVYVMLPAKGGVKLRAAANSSGVPRLERAPGRGHLAVYATNAGLKEIAGLMEDVSRRPVIDKTLLAGSYDFQFEYSSFDGPDVDDDAPAAPPFLSAIQHKLGLVLTPARGPVEVLVVDKWNAIPTAN
jgi:bla regulator protein blaR1